MSVDRTSHLHESTSAEELDRVRPNDMVQPPFAGLTCMTAVNRTSSPVAARAFIGFVATRPPFAGLGAQTTGAAVTHRPIERQLHGEFRLPRWPSVSSASPRSRLFFDLVLVAAITQVTRLMSDDPTWHGLGRGLLVLAALWWSWTGYAWPTNTLEPEEGIVRAGMFAAMAAMLIVALAVPQAFDADAVLFGVAYLIVRLLHLGLYAIAGKRDPDLLGAVLRLVPVATLAPILIVAAGFFDGRTQAALWVVALAVDYFGVLIGRMQGWHISPAHFAERHGLIVIIALGESVVAIGIGAAAESLTPGIVVAAVLGIVIIAALWWAYFYVYAVGERQRPLSDLHGGPRRLHATTTATSTCR